MDYGLPECIDLVHEDEVLAGLLDLDLTRMLQVRVAVYRRIEAGDTEKRSLAVWVVMASDDGQVPVQASVVNGDHSFETKWVEEDGEQGCAFAQAVVQEGSGRMAGLSA